MESVQKVGIVVEIVLCCAVEVDATLDEVWVILGLVDDDRADTKTEDQEDDKRKYWGVNCILLKKVRMFKKILLHTERILLTSSMTLS